MFKEFIMLNSEQLSRTFERIGLCYSPDLPRDYDTLSAIQYGFQKNVPYENLDILKKIPLSLDYDRLYEKIVVNKRGGYCFEINGFLGEVYRSLGFEVTEYMARYLRGESDIPMRRHRVLGVTTDDGKKYICDAGIGQSAFRLPLLMEENSISRQYGEEYLVTREPFFGWMISDFHKGNRRCFYAFTEEEQLNHDFVMPSFWCENSPDSPFTSAEMFSIKTDSGRITLDGNVFRIFDGDNVSERTLTEDEVRVAYEKFGLPYDEKIARGLRRVPISGGTNHVERARELFLSGCNCAQAIFCAFEDVTGYSHEEAMRISSSFGGGIGRMREVCGTVSGAAMVAGILWGYSETNDDRAKAAHYALIQELAGNFREKYGTIICRELLRGIADGTSPIPDKRTDEYYKKRPCLRFVVTMAEILDDMIVRRGAEQ